MDFQQSQDSCSPSGSSTSLPLGRRESRGSMATTQTERESMNAALDHYHNTAYQSESLTLFNDFTSPPAPAATSEEKGLSDELQGGLSGLYSRFRTSVGGVRDIVSGGGKSTDKNATEIPAVKSPVSERSMAKSVSDLATSSVDYPPSQPNSSQGSRLHSPVVPDFHTHPDSVQQSNVGKRSRISSKSGSISSKASVSPSPGIKPSIAPLTKATGGAIVADPAVTQLHVNVIGNTDRSGSSSVNVPFQGIHNAESTSIGSKDGPTDLSLSQTSSSLSQNLSSSPTLSAKMHDSNHEENNRKDSFFSTTYTPDHQSRKSIPTPDQQKLPEIPTQSTNVRNQKQAEPFQDHTSQHPAERSKSRTSFPYEEPKASVSASNSLSRLPSQGDVPYNDESSPINMETNILRDSANANEPPKGTAPGRSNEESTSSIRATRLPGYVISRASTAETTTTASSLSPLNTTVDRATGQSVPAKRQAPAENNGVLSQLRSKLLSRDFWMRDENAKDCFHCGEPFTTFRRKHHCRTCGQIFDSKCTLLISGTRFGQPGSIRVCKPCEKMINAHDDDSSEFSDSEQSPIVGNPRVAELNWTNTGRTSADDDDSSSVVSQSIDHVLRTPTMAIPATRRAGEGHNRRSAILEIDSDRHLARPTSSRSLRSSLGGRPHSIGHKRHHSRQQYIRGFKPNHEDRAPFQRRHADEVDVESRLPAFHKDNIIDPDIAQYLSDDASSGDEQPSLLSAVSEGTLSKSGGESERASFIGLLAAVKKGRSAFGDRNAPSINREGDDASITSSRAVNLPRFSRRRNMSVTSNFQPRHSPRTSKDNMLSHDTSVPAISLPGGSKQVGFKMTRSSSMRGNDAPPVELNKASLEHVRKLLHQLLLESAVPNGDSWENALMPILLKAADEVDPDVQNGDDMDIRHYVKLKKIPGGRPSDTSYVSGLVFTKNLALKGMSRNILRPNILIITFPLEYARQQQHFMSLEPVIRQEREFLENLVSRISALRPNLLLVEKTVSGLALGLLEQAGIATAYNVKPSVLEAVSRCTQTRIMTSMDKLLTTTLHSECSSFDVKTYVHNGRKKTYIYISGCPKELGCTIILRGGDNRLLAKVKRIAEFMVYVVYNLRLETNVMRDEFGRISTSTAEESTTMSDEDKNKLQTVTHGVDTPLVDPCTAQQEKNDKLGDISDSQILVDADGAKVPDSIPMPTYYNDMVQDYETKILSASPFVKFEAPYLLTRAREMERRLSYLKSLRDQDSTSDQITDEKVKPQKFVLITPEMVHQSPQNAPAKVKEVLRAAHEAEYDRALYHHQTQKRQWEAYVAGNPNMFDPYAHQNIVILYSVVCTTTSVPCSGPDTFALEFYNEHGDDTVFESDLTIGQYVEELCETANSICTVNGCEKRMFEHHRQYVHGEAQISVLVQPYPSKLLGLHNTVLMWSCCKVCGNETQVMPMSKSTWKYSFGKYLELSFWGRHMLARTGGCSHDLRRDYLHFFGYNDLALRVQYDPIRLLEIIVPRPRVTWKVDNDLKMRNEVYLRTEQRINNFMASVQDRLKGMNAESVVPELKESCKTEIENLIKKGHEDHSSLVRHLQDKYTSSRYWEIIPLNEVLRAVQEKVVEWDTTFVNFEMNFFPSEKDIKHMATLQLRKIFLDKDATPVSTDDTLQAPADVEDENNQAVDRPRMMRRMTLSPEKAQNVLVSVVEEHAGKKHREELQEVAMQSPPLLADQATLSVDAADGTRSSPQNEIISQEEVRHLDLAVPAGQSERSSVGHADISNQSSIKTDLPVMISGDGSSESSPPESSEISDQGTKNGTEDNKASDMPSTPVRRPSAIPRPTEPAFRRPGKTRSPPLLRTQSQPANIPRSSHSIPLPGLKTAFTGPIDPEKSSGQSPTKSSDRTLSDRLGLSSLKSARFASGHSLIPRSAPSKRGTSQVSHLARHFEQLSREFEKERQRERRQRAAKGTHSRAFPLASSKPIVEVYRNVREAVEEREPPVDSDESLPSAPRIPMDNMSRKSDELTHENITHDEPSLPNDSTPEPTEGGSALCPDNQPLSGGEADDHQSDEEQNMIEDLHPVVSHEETKQSAEDYGMEYKELPKHERTTLLKMLTNFWSERSASGWASLEYPLSVMDHVFADCNIIVREDEPSSLVAFALDSFDYKEKLSSIQQQFDGVEEHKPDARDEIDAKKEARIERALLRRTGTHLKYQFQEGQAKMLCKVFYAEQFDALRKKCGVADRIVESLSRCAKWDSKGGKTKSLFLKTLDDRFILKSLSTIETQAFLKFAPAYFQIMAEALFHELPSAIAKMFGFYQVIIKNPVTGTEFNWFLLLMENLFYDRVPTRIFDLKGSMRNRKVESTGERDEVLLDENMVDFIYETPLFAREHSKKLLSQSVWNDTLFLGRQDVMDYSLMIAIDESRDELVVGIIDCIRTYTWDKKLESWIKDKGFGGGGRNRPTVTSPREYKGRFREAMARYVLRAPSCWHQFQPTATSRYEAETVDERGYAEGAGS
ncbi:Zinc finger FYVE/PHD-type [Penicillium coprophilum]|uniref:Zinc finger FYVE/PHD-type n=1 Tax=Penicillium coprophilum TaxID=36646 RepID=UPI00238ED6AA|nr:Zinc finger FYVE/PHD-type [Penicillium coprophilum]KAJ5163101.1 Zinc finger FYVE/PHD-type [Penicillium coprophilum]